MNVVGKFTVFQISFVFTTIVKTKLKIELTID